MSYSILHVITTIDLGGAEKQLLTLATCQKEKGIDVEVIFLKDKPTLLQDFLKVGVKVDSSFAGLGFLRQVLKLKQKKIQKNLVVHAHLPRAELLCALSLKQDSFVVTRHNSEAFFPKGSAKLSQLLSRFTLERAFASISISKAVANYLISSREISSLENNHVIYYGLKSTSVSQKKKIGIRSHSVQLGTVSRLVPQKNLPLLLSALKELNYVNSPSFKLAVMGTGPLEKELQSITVRLGVEKKVTWKGQSKDILAFYDSLDVFVLPSNYEGFGLVLLEAMSKGIPVVARRISAIPEVMGERHPGLVNSDKPIDLANKIREFLDNKEILDSCLKYQAVRLQEFSIDRTQLAHERLYLSLLEPRKMRI
jgi:glycosyltransferase involved in cell wall biosynthesis